MIIIPLTLLRALDRSEFETLNGNGKIRSLICTEKISIGFINSTNREVDVLWINYEGLQVKYGTISPKKMLTVNTYVTHPWAFQDSKTKDKLVVDNLDVFFPPRRSELEKIIHQRFHSQVFEHGLRIAVRIKLPMYSLRERCLQVVRDNINLELTSTSQLQLPKSVEDDLIVMLLKKDGYYL